MPGGWGRLHPRARRDAESVARLVRHAPRGCAGRGRALVAAAAVNGAACVRVLLDAGVDAGFQDGAPLLAAARNEASPAVVRMLLEAGADANAGNGHAFAAACALGDREVLRAFLEHGADANGGRGRPLREAASQ